MAKREKPVVPALKARIRTSVTVSVVLEPGEWIIGTWSIVRIDFQVYLDENTGRWFTHVCYGNFRGVRGILGINGKPRQNRWSGVEAYPGFSPRIEYIPQKVWNIVRETYESWGDDVPEFLPPPDMVKGKGPAR